MNKLVEILTLKGLKGSRSQITAIVALLVNVLVQLNVLTINPDEQRVINEFFVMVFAYFFADKKANNG